MVERLKQRPAEGKRRPVLPATAVFHRLLRQEAGKLRYLSPASRPAGMSFGRFFSSAHVSVGRRFIYVKNDKVGSSFIIRSLTGSEKHAEQIRYRTPFLDPRRNPLLTPAELTRRQWNEALASFFVFTFCRNPFSRILSCYLDRIVGRDESYFVLKKRIGATGDFAPTFPEFLEMLGEPGVIDLDTHWMPQHRNIAIDYYPYRFIGHFEDFTTEFPALLAWLYGGKESSARCARAPQRPASLPPATMTRPPGSSATFTGAISSCSVMTRRHPTTCAPGNGMPWTSSASR